MAQMVELLGFQPDLSPYVPGVMVRCTNVLPVEQGFAAGGMWAASFGGVGLGADCRGATCETKIDGTLRTFAGTPTKLYEFSGGAWVDRSRAGNYSGGASSRWSFTQFGNVSLASNDTEVIQASNGSGSFADIAGAPKARVIFAVGDFVMALNTNDATFGDQGDRWWCCGIFDHTSWAPSVSSQANSGRLVQVGGDLVAGLALGRQAVAYKQRSMYLGTYVGGTVVWQWDTVPGAQGAVGPEAVCNADGVHVFMGLDNVYLFDGTRVRSIGDGVRKWLSLNIDPAYRDRSIVRYDRRGNRVWMFFTRRNSGFSYPTAALVYHLGTGKWGRADRSVGASFEYIDPTTQENILTVFDPGSNSAEGLTGTFAVGVFKTGFVGSPDGSSTCKAVHLRCTNDNVVTASVQLTSYPSAPHDGGGGSANSAVYDKGRFDLKLAGKWFDAEVTFSGASGTGGGPSADVPFETTVSAIGFDLKQSGKR